MIIGQLRCLIILLQLPESGEEGKKEVDGGGVFSPSAYLSMYNIVSDQIRSFPTGYYDSTTQQVLGRQVAMQNSNRDVRVRVQCDDNNNIELSKLRLISYCLTIDNYWPLVCRIINNRRNSRRPAQWEPPLCTGAAHKHNKSIIIISHHHHNHHLQCCLRLDTI